MGMVRSVELTDLTGVPPKRGTFLGLEDIQLFGMLGSELQFLATMPQLHPTKIPMVWGGIQPETGQIKHLKWLDSGSNVEKNWLPVPTSVRTDSVDIIYSMNPTKVIHVTPAVAWLKSSHPEVPGGFLRGSASPIPWEEGYLAITHQVARYDLVKNYYHRWILLDEEFRIVRMSPLWVLEGYGVEFVRSMTQSHRDGCVWLGVGIGDREAWLYEVEMETIREMLKAPQ